MLCDEQPAKRTIVLRFRDGGLHETDETHRAYDFILSSYFLAVTTAGISACHSRTLPPLQVLLARASLPSPRSCAYRCVLERRCGC